MTCKNILKLTLLAAAVLPAAVLSAAPWHTYIAKLNPLKRAKDYQGIIDLCEKALADKDVQGQGRTAAFQHVVGHAMKLKQYDYVLKMLDGVLGTPEDNPKIQYWTRLQLFDVYRGSKVRVINPRLIPIAMPIPECYHALPEQKGKAAEKTAAGYQKFCDNFIWGVAKFNDRKSMAELIRKKDLMPADSKLKLTLLHEILFENKPAADVLAAHGDELKKFSIKEQYDLLCGTASCLLLMDDQNATEILLAESKKLEVPFKRNVYQMKGVQRAPVGSGGWIITDAWNKIGATNFTPYNYSAAAALLEADVASERAIDSKNLKAAEKAKILAEHMATTTFHFSYDVAGIHLFVVCPEKNLDQFEAKGGGAGSLEIFFAPGEEAVTYQQFIINLPTGKIDCYPKNSILRTNRNLADFIKTDTTCRDGKMGVYVFIPWDYCHDDLPFDTGKNWRFNLIRWTPAGGISWGGRVHEPGRMGNLVWDKPAPELLQKIRSRLAVRAIAKYQRIKADRLQFWQDELLGDPAFAKECLEPAFASLDKAVADYQAGTLKPEEFAAKYQPDLMEADYLVQELRKAFLEKKFLQNAQ